MQTVTTSGPRAITESDELEGCGKVEVPRATTELPEQVGDEVDGSREEASEWSVSVR